MIGSIEIRRISFSLLRSTFKCDNKADTKLDNTGDLKFRENDPIPTLEFPSDHSIVSTTLTESASASM